MARDFVAENYSWFLDTFDNYDQPIQRADAIRYFILVHYGGVYIDLDDVSRFSGSRGCFWRSFFPSAGGRQMRSRWSLLISSRATSSWA